MRPALALHLLLLSGVGASLAGCASKSEPPAPYVPRTAEGYEARPAAALAYSPGNLDAWESAELESALAREGRGNAAFVGYDLPTVSTYTLWVDDRQRTLGVGRAWGGGGIQLDNYERRAISTRSFVRHR